jgi:hypothetical protein
MNSISNKLNTSVGSTLALLGVVGLAGCAAGPDSEDEARLGQADSSIVVFAEESTCVTLFAGQTSDAGTVCASIDNTVDTSAECGPGATGVMDVTFSTTGGWELQEAHLAVGDDLADIPANKKGNPKIGNFPYNSGDITGATSQSFSVPLCELGLDGAQESCDPVTAYLAAHAAVRKDNGDGSYQTETGWGDGDRFVDRGSWAEYFNLTLECTTEEEPPPPPPADCETAFSLGEQCFLDIDEDDDGSGDFNRWGWREQLDGSYVADIYAGAGQCSTGKGTLVGSLIVTDNGDGYFGVEYDIASGFYLDETHLYIGDSLPVNSSGESTVAPGQYTEIHESLAGATSDSYTLPGRVGDYLIAHAVVCGAF